ncbi:MULTISPECIES: gamma carbonic anhydrase family protein [Salinibaculum]|uniref:gamma carbonic anhydrase family protein n=1 Tax=Salinibaculum TaxID=2732368 RepID=UPI0030CF7BEB
MLRAVDGMEPDVADSAYVDEAAVVIGDVVVEDEASVWPNTTLRGDHGQIVVGERANVQDNAVLHEDAVLGPDVTVGHSAIVHACTVERGALVGMNAVVLDDAHIGEGAVVAAGSVVTDGTEVPPETMVVGAPAEVKAELDGSMSEATAEHYADLARTYEATGERLDER